MRKGTPALIAARLPSGREDVIGGAEVDTFIQLFNKRGNTDYAENSFKRTERAATMLGIRSKLGELQ